jgi:type III secretion protein V
MTTATRAKSVRLARFSSRPAIQAWLSQVLTRHGDAGLVLLMVAVIALLVLPLPTVLLDGLIATNLAASISLLMLSLYVPSALGLSTFPSLLLLTTLFRVSLNIASTKLILLHAHAGHVIEAFGRMVVGGNVVVGLVVFLTIAIVQFIVIAKGAERVAEVGARFSLDGMPGKQMSIDADLRAGNIDKEQAQRRRREIEEESQLHGAMDGAMKFVKGDAIAGILIAFVNIVAGMTIGMSMRGMPLAQAVNTYSVLSVGDGMVAQIPSLFVSIAAGIVITRVDGRSRSHSHLGAQIVQQALRQPEALLMAGSVVAVFLLVPGLPTWPFLCLAALLLSVGYVGRATGGRVKPLDVAAVPAVMRDGVSPTREWIDDQDVPVAVPLRVRIAPDVRSLLSAVAFDSALSDERSLLSRNLGLPFPGLRMQVEASLAPARYAIDVQELQVAQGELRSGPMPIDPTSGPERALTAHIAQVVAQHADVFVGMQEVHTLLVRAASQLPDLAAEVQRAVPIQRIAEVLRRLVQEGVSIRYLREICESLLTWAPREKDTVMLTEYVRVDLGRFTVRRFVDGKGTLRAVLLDGEAERVVREAIQQGPGGGFLSLNPEASKALMAGAESVLVSAKFTGQPVLLAPMELRRYLKKFLGTRFSSLAVLSIQELPADVQIQTAGRLVLHYESRSRAA